MKIVTRSLFLLVPVLLVGCGAAVEELDAGAEMAVTNETVEITELQKIVGEYEAAVVEKIAELEALKEKVREIPIGEMVDEQTKVFKGAVEEVADSLGKMMEDLAGHLDELTPEADQK